MYSLKFHLISGIISYILIVGYDFRDHRVKEVPYLIHQALIHSGKARLLIDFLTIMVFGPLAIPFYCLFRWYKVRR